MAILAIIGSLTSDNTKHVAHTSQPSQPITTAPPVVATTESQTVKAPNLVGLPLIRAANRVKKADLEIHLAKKYSNKQPGTVLATDPPAGTVLEVGDRLTLIVSKPFPQVARVVGPLIGKAQRTLKHDGFKVRTRQEFDSSHKGNRPRAIATSRDPGPSASDGGPYHLDRV